MSTYNAADERAMHTLARAASTWNHPEIRKLPPEARDIVGTVIAEAVNSQYPPSPISAQAQRSAQQMREIGFSFLGQVLDDTQIAEIASYYRNRPCYNLHYEGHIHGDGVARGVDDGASAFHFGSYTKEDILEAPHLINLFLRPDVLDIAESFLGARPMLFSINTYWSFPQNEPPSYGQEFHRDISHPRFCVLFVYLTDAMEKTGAHQYIKKTQSVPILGAHLEARNAKHDARHFFTLPMDGLGYAELYEKELGDLFETIPGKAGTAFFEDTYGIHRGLPPENEPRLLAWARYSLFTAPPDLEMAPNSILGDRYPDDERARYALRGITV
jgi:hypothetical protein